MLSRLSGALPLSQPSLSKSVIWSTAGGRGDSWSWSRPDHAGRQQICSSWCMCSVAPLHHRAVVLTFPVWNRAGVLKEVQANATRARHAVSTFQAHTCQHSISLHRVASTGGTPHNLNTRTIRQSSRGWARERERERKKGRERDSGRERERG